MKIKKINRGRSRNLILDMTPLIDVVFLLLIFFMVATSVKDASSSINIELPKSSSGEKLERKIIEVKIDKDRKIYLIEKVGKEVKSEVLSLQEFKEKLPKVIESSSEKDVLISGNKDIEYQYLVGVLDIVKKSGATSLDLNTAPSE